MTPSSITFSYLPAGTKGPLFFLFFETIARLHGLQVVSVFMSSEGRRSA